MYNDEKITVNGRVFDLPSWLSITEFADGVHGNDAHNPLSSLISLEHIPGSDEDGGDYEDEYYGESYHASFLIPFKSSRVLCRAGSAFSRAEVYANPSIITELTGRGLLLSFDVAQDRAGSEVQAHYYPDDGFKSLADGVNSLSTDNTKIASDYIQSLYKDNQRASDFFIRKVESPKHDSRVIGIITHGN